MALSPQHGHYTPATPGRLAGMGQWQPQVRGVQPQAPEADSPAEPPELLLAFEGAANTESWMVCFALAHFGHVMAVLWFITMRS